MRLARAVQHVVVWPNPPHGGGLFRWAWWVVRAAVGLPSRRTPGGEPRRPVAWAVRFGQALAVRLLLIAAVLVLTVRAAVDRSLPQLDGEAALPDLSAPVRVDRDARGVPTISAATRTDAAAALGFLHAQERLFQMDGTRRYAAGEMAALVGPAALDLDRRTRVHGFRDVARRVIERLNSDDRAVLDAYARGVNAGRAALRTRPFEYLLLRTDPEPWQPEDSVLVLLAMMLNLQDDTFDVEAALGVVHDAIPVWYPLLAPGGSADWDAPLDGSAAPNLHPLPGPDTFDLRRDPWRAAIRTALPDRGGLDQIDPPPEGSNNWAVGGAHTRHGGALLANDMHLDIRVPNTWYRAGFDIPPGERPAVRAWGATLPGCPGLVVGSNGRVAWGLTNSEGDWSDLVRLTLDAADPSRYRTPDGFKPFEVRRELIRVRGRADDVREVRWTIWGPVLDSTPYLRDHPRALRWVAHNPSALGFEFLGLLDVGSVREALDVAVRTGGPHQNFVAADAAGNIGWALTGRIPVRRGFDGRKPEAGWATGACGWEPGYLPAADVPRVENPPGGRIWTANNRVVGGEALARIGFGNYDRGARALQIRDRLRAKDRLTEADMFAIQLDDEALFLARWQRLLLGVLDGPPAGADPARQKFRAHVADWGGRAAAGSVGYRAVHEFRGRVVRAVLEPITAMCRQRADTFGIGLLPRDYEDAVWRVVSERPAHLLDPRYGSWDELLLTAADGVRAAAGPDPSGWTWGRKNTAAIRNPLSPALLAGGPAGRALHRWLDPDMPAEPLNGGWADVPRLQAPVRGASQQMVVAPGREADGYFQMPGGQSGHPRSPHYRDHHGAWVDGEPTPFLPGPTVHTLMLRP